MLDDDTSWHVRHLIQQEFQKLAKEMHDTLRASGVNPNNEAYAAFKSVALCLEIRVSRMVGRLQREADEAKNAEDDRRNSTHLPFDEAAAILDKQARKDAAE